MNQKKPYQVAKTTNNYHPPDHRKKQQQYRVSREFFQGNLVQNMRFGGKDHDLSGYVERQVVMKDKHGNVQIAREKQFFNASKNGMHVRVRDNDRRH